MKKNRIIAGITSLMIGITNLMPAIMANASTEAKASKLEMSVTLWGDANCDNEVTIADSVFIMKVISYPDKYGLGQDEGITEQGMFNADVYQHGTALTYADALSVCKFHIGIITELPESYYQELPNTTTTTTTTTETTTTTTKPTTTTTTKTTTTTTKPTTTTTTKTTTTTTKPTTTTTTKTTTITNPSTTTTMTTTTDDWNPPSKEALVHKGEQIEENTYNILLATAELFNIKEYDIIWSPVPIEGAYTDPGAYYCMRNGLAYGYGVQIIDSNNVTKVCPSMKRGPASQFIMDKYAVFRPEVPADSEPRVLESFEVADLCKKSDGQIVAGLWDLTEVDPSNEFDLEWLNRDNSFNFMNWYLIPIKDGEAIDEPYNLGQYNLSTEPGAEIEYWFTNDELGEIIVRRDVFYDYVNTAKQLGIKKFKIEYNDNVKEPIIYSFVDHVGGHSVQYKKHTAYQVIPLADLDKVVDVEAWTENSATTKEDLLWTIQSKKYYFWTLRENEISDEPIPDYFYTSVLWEYLGDTYDGHVMIPLTEDGEEDLRLYWPVQ